jgi:para-nitrobenzyl esterase
MPEPPMQTLLAGRGARVPVLLGTNLDEIRFWSVVEELPLERKPEALLRSQLAPIVGNRAQTVIDIYRQDAPDPGSAVIQLETDLLFRMTSIRMAEKLSTAQPIYMYLFTYQSTSPNHRLGSAHAMELPFVFGNVDELDAITFTGRDPHRQALMEQVQGAWLAFATRGVPDHPGLPVWPRYDSSARATMELGIDSRVVLDPHSSQRAAWDGVPFDNVSPSGAEVSAFLSDNGVP